MGKSMDVILLAIATSGTMFLQSLSLSTASAICCVRNLSYISRNAQSANKLDMV